MGICSETVANQRCSGATIVKQRTFQPARVNAVSGRETDNRLGNFEVIRARYARWIHDLKRLGKMVRSNTNFYGKRKVRTYVH